MFERIKAYFKGYAQNQTRYNVTPVNYGSRVFVDANSNLTYATCINIMANMLAQCRWATYDAEYNVVEQIPRMRSVLNIQPYPGIIAYDFWEFMEKQRLGSGNAYALISYDRGAMLRYLIPLDAGAMNVVWDDANILDGKRQILYQYADKRTGQTYTMLPDEILHFKAFSQNGIVGRSALSVLSEELRASAEVEGALRTAVQNGFAGTIVLTHTSDLSLSKQKVLQDQVMELLKNKDRAIVPLPVGMNASNIANDIKGYYEILRQAKTEEISALFGVPLAMLNKMGGTGAATFSASQMNSFFSMTIQPIIIRYANELTAKLLPRQKQDGGYRIATENDPFDTLDPLTKSTVLANYVGGGILTANEARRSLAYPLSNDTNADILTQRGGTGRLGDSPGNEGGRGNVDT